MTSIAALDASTERKHMMVKSCAVLPHWHGRPCRPVLRAMCPPAIVTAFSRVMLHGYGRDSVGLMGLFLTVPLQKHFPTVSLCRELCSRLAVLTCGREDGHVAESLMVLLPALDC